MLRSTRLKSIPVLSVGLALLAAISTFPNASASAASHATTLSDFVGAYALIDKVVLEPNDAAPETIQVWGAFALAQTEDRNTYENPRRGYYYYSLKSGKEEACRKEWADFKAAAGTGQVIGFGARNQPMGRLRKADEKAANPDAYPIAWGLTRMSQRPSNYAPVRELRSLPAPHSPAEGAEVKAGKVTLVTGNIADREWKNIKYVFEIRANGPGEQETSPPVAAGEKETQWSPNLKVKAGEKYTWRVKVTDGQLTGPAATSEFKGAK